MDGGFCSEKNIDLLLEQQSPFIMGIPAHMKTCVKLRQENQALISKTQYHLRSHGIQAMRFKCHEYKQRTFLHMFFSGETAFLQESHFYQALDRMEEALQKGETPKGSDAYFQCRKADDGRILVTRNNLAIDEKLASLGYFFLLTSDEKLSSSDLLTIYRNKDVIEKNFDNLKNAVDLKRLHTHSLQATEGKLFVSFLALILRAHLMNASQAWRIEQSASLDKLLWELKKIKVVEFGATALLNPLTKKQKQILALFHLDQNDILACI